MSWLQTLRAAWRESHPALRLPDRTLDYAELDSRIRRAAGWLVERGLTPGDVLALQVPDRLTFLVLHLAALGRGLTTLPLNTTYPPAELRYYLSDAGASLALVAPGVAEDMPGAPCTVLASDAVLQAEIAAAPEAALLEDLPADHLAVLLYTSGTTGRPKGAMLSHANLQATVDGLVEAWRWSSDDVLLHMLPLFHVHGLFVAMHAALRVGATTILAPRFDAEAALATMAREGVTIFMGVPTFYARLLARLPGDDPDLSGMRLFTSGSAPLPARDHRAFEARYGHRILERYGMTEVGIVLTNPYQGERRPGAVGFAVPGASVRIADPDTGGTVEDGTVGEVRIAGPSVFRGYLGRPAKTAEALVEGWMCSGDLGYRDEDGYVHLVGRSKDMVLSGGLNVYPSEVEAVLIEHPSVAAAAVVGVPDPDLGERVVAAVIPREGETVSTTALQAYARQALAPYKVPRWVTAVDAFPRNAMGKVQKAEIRRRLGAIVCRMADPDEADDIATWNVAMALETEDLALDPARARAGAARVFHGDVGAFYLRAEVAGQVVGQCMVTDEWSDWRNTHVWWLQSVYVPRPWRGRGVFRTMYDHVREEARAAGAAGVRLYVDRRNAGAQAVYDAVGMSHEHYALYEDLFDAAPTETAFPERTSDGTLPRGQPPEAS